MNKYNKSFLALTLGLITIIGAASAASARWGGPHHGGGHGYGCGSMQAPSPEAQKLMEDSYNAMAPLVMELRAKQDELTAKIYGGSDEATINSLSKDVNRLHDQVTQARVSMQQKFAKAGIPMYQAGRGCMGMNMHRGWHGGNAPAPQAN